MKLPFGVSKSQLYVINQPLTALPFYSRLHVSALFASHYQVFYKRYTGENYIPHNKYEVYQIFGRNYDGLQFELKWYVVYDADRK